MITYAFLDEIEKNFPLILNGKSTSPADIDEMAVDYSVPLENQLIRQLSLLESKTNLFLEAYKCNDEVTMKAALLEMRTHSMSLSGFFDAIAEDATLLIKTNGWPDIPENYRVPEHYKFLHK
ncbi:hypothetical protein ACGVWS_15760 [Enterobacteriaceae bacterium LUAb1]